MASDEVPSLMTLPPELREMIYYHIFFDCHQQHLVTNLIEKVPYSTPLRLTSKHIYLESSTIYNKATKYHNANRASLISQTIQSYESSYLPAYEHGFHSSQAGNPNLHHLSLSLCHPNPDCKHPCAARACYMCGDPQHQACFHCGRNLAVALWCKIREHEHETPRLIKTGSNGGQPTHLGAWLKHIPRRAVAQQVDGEGKVSWPWAWCWWQMKLQWQTAIDLRCGIRRFAVEKYYRGSDQSKQKWHGSDPTDERVIRWIEAKDRRMNTYRKIVTAICKHDETIHFEWREEYQRRIEAKALPELCRRDGHF